jgi:hypothetical protein
MATMHTDFPGWYNEISADGAGRNERWVGVTAFAKDATKARIEVLVRLALVTKPLPSGNKQPALEEALTAFHQAFSDEDAGYVRAARQDQILAAATLVKLFETSSLAALAVVATDCGGARLVKLPMDLVALAQNALARLAAARRMRPDMSKVEIKVPEVGFEADFSSIPANSPAALNPVFEELRDQVDVALAGMADQMNAALKKMTAATNMADEELDMLLWVFGGRSLTSGKAFGDVATSAQPLIFAEELAARTKIWPGPRAVPALLSRAGVKTKGKITIVECVDAVSDTWTTNALRNLSPSPATSPIHQALERRQETGAGGGWQTGWSAVTGIDAAAAFTPLQLAELFYSENLWLRKA